MTRLSFSPSLIPLYVCANKTNHCRRNFCLALWFNSIVYAIFGRVCLISQIHNRRKKSKTIGMKGCLLAIAYKHTYNMCCSYWHWVYCSDDLMKTANDDNDGFVSMIDNNATDADVFRWCEIADAADTVFFSMMMIRVICSGGAIFMPVCVRVCLYTLCM